jgi:NADH:ubiquinone oxidoreductase subunit 3 (subunit A)
VSVLLVTLGVVFSVTKHKCRSKSTPFECGFSSVGFPCVRFSVPFYLLMLVFVVFDMEIVIFLGFVFSGPHSLLLFLLFWLLVALTYYLEDWMGTFRWSV